jgi:threonylcarbamoyladenosine tRNA methylthiotransferase MtaB
VKKFKIVTLGCRTNQYESQAYADQLKKVGFQAAQEGDVADLCIVNTCTITEAADSSSRHQIRQILRDHPGAEVAVTGCMAQSASDVIRGLDPKIRIVPNERKEDLLKELLPETEEFPEFNIKTFDAHTRAFVKVQDGCDSFCTYCVVPYVRGRSRSRPIDDVVREVRGLILGGFKEVVLTGVNIGDFDGGGRLADLVRAVDKVEGLQRLRISSIDPDEVDEDLTEAVLNGKTTAPSMHLVLQSGSNVILKRMNRKYTRQIFLETFEKLKRQRPEFTATTDVIVGFPGETEDDFAETLDVLRRVRFAKVHWFPYSPRKRTRAALYPNQIPPDVMKKRKIELQHAAEAASFALRAQFLGSKMNVLLEGTEEEGFLSGHTENFLKVSVPSHGLRANDLVACTLVENTPTGLLGRL